MRKNNGHQAMPDPRKFHNTERRVPYMALWLLAISEYKYFETTLLAKYHYKLDVKILIFWYNIIS